MLRLRRLPVQKTVRLFAVAIASVLLFLFTGCGGHKPSGSSPFPGKIFLTPETSASMQLGSTLTFTANAQNSNGSNVTTTFTYQSSDTTILNMAPGGVACAGVWDPDFVTCTPQNYGLVQVTATALGTTSVPTLVYVHPPIDNVQISAVCPANGIPPACPGPQSIPLACISEPTQTKFPSCTPGQSMTQAPPCLSANQSMTLQANAFSKGLDITASVGPFTWAETSSSAITVVPFVTDNNTNVPTNQATITPAAPGFTAVYASASNVSSQPYYAETCPVQCVGLSLGDIGSGQTSFAANKSTSETAVATAVDVQGCVVPNPTLTWTSSQPAAVTAGSSSTGCATGTTCTLTTTQPGSGSVSASCIPPTCNIGFPQSVAGLPPNNLVQPVPVYPATAISGLVSGAASSTSVLATSLDCATNFYCGVHLYDISTASNVSGNPTELPAPPNSMLFDPAGDKAYMGGNFGAVIVAPANIGTANNPFTVLGSVTGTVLAVSENGNNAIFSDVVHTPNQVYVINSSTAAITTLNISGATAAAFSPDGLKAFIIGPAGPSCNLSPPAPACLYVYSPIQALQTLPLAAPATGITFSSSGAFAFINGGSTTSSLSVYNTCDNSNNPLVITFPAAPLFLNDLPPGNPPQPVASAAVNPACDPQTAHGALNCAGLDVLVGLDNTGLDLVALNTWQPAVTQSCPQTIAVASNPTTLAPLVLRFDLGQGTFHPINFFMSPDGSTAYIVTSDRSDILVYDFNTNSTSGIPLVSATGSPVSAVTASMTVDGTLIYVACSDGELHEVSTTIGTDLMQIPFPNLPDVTNPFCSTGATTIACNLDVVGVKP